MRAHRVSNAHSRQSGSAKQYYTIYVETGKADVFVVNLWAVSKTQAEKFGEGLRRKNKHRYPRGPIRARLV